MRRMAKGSAPARVSRRGGGLCFAEEEVVQRLLQLACILGQRIGGLVWRRLAVQQQKLLHCLQYFGILTSQDLPHQHQLKRFVVHNDKFTGSGQPAAALELYFLEKLMSVATHALESCLTLFRYYKKLGDGALAQLSEHQLHHQPDPEANSIATIVKHLHGNMLSRWTDFLSTDGEKPWRDRDGEFEDTLSGRAEVLQAWEDGWAVVFRALVGLKPADLERIVYIRNEGHTVLEAIHRQLGHYAYHVGQLVYWAKHLCGSQWQSLSVPKGGSEAFNAAKFSTGKRRKHFTQE